MEFVEAESNVLDVSEEYRGCSCGEYFDEEEEYDCPEIKEMESKLWTE